MQPDGQADQMRGLGASFPPEVLAPDLPDLLEQDHGRLDQWRQYPNHRHLCIGAGGARGGAQRMRLQHLPCQIQCKLPALAFELAAGGKKQGGDAALTGQTQGAVHQQQVVGPDACAFQPDARQLDVLAKAALRKGLVGAGQAQRGDIPAHQLGPGHQVQRQVVFGQAAAVAKGFHRQPLGACAGFEANSRALQGGFARRPIEARGAGGGDQAVAAGRSRDRDVQRIAAHQAARRVHQHVVAHGVAFGVQALQDAQRAVMAEVGDGLAGLQGVVEGERCVPGHRWRLTFGLR